MKNIWKSNLKGWEVRKDFEIDFEKDMIEIEKDMIENYFEKGLKKKFKKIWFWKLKLITWLTRNLKDKILKFKDWTFLNRQVTNLKFLNQSH